MKVSHSCPHCGCGKNSAEHVSKHKCRMCGGSWSSFLSSAANMGKKIAANPMVQKMASSALQKYAPGLASKAQAVMSHPMAQKALASPYGQAALGAVRSHVGLGRKRKAHPKYGAMLALGQMTPGEEAYVTKRASGRRRKGGKGGLPGGLGMATQVLGAIPGAAEALGPFGALLGIEPPPPPPPHATFSAVRAGPVMSARPRTVGRGGFGFGDVMNFGKSALGAVKSVASNPMLQQLASAAAPYAMQAAQRYAPGAVSAANRAIGAYNTISSNPYGQAALGAVRSRVGLGKRKRAPTAHSLAVGRVMKQTGMGLAQASKYVKENGLAQ
jgi:hypothetical protein